MHLNRGRAPRVRPPRGKWAVAALLVAGLIATGVGGYRLGKDAGSAGLPVPVRLRAYLNRPLDMTLPSEEFWIAGYYVDYDRTSLDTVRNWGGQIDQVVVFGYELDREGRLAEQESGVIKGLVGSQKRIILFSNCTDDGFSREVAHRLLTDSEAGERAQDAIVAKTLQLNGAGVQIDFENIPPEDREAYTNFLQRLKEKLLPHDLSLSVAVAAKTDDDLTGWGGAADYPALGQITDQLYIMAYDQHWQASPAGPVAALDWTEQVIRYAIGVVPSQKILLGTPLYGYEWPADGGGGARAFSAPQMARRVDKFGGSVQWVPECGENKATYDTPEGPRVAWYPDVRSLEARMKLAYRYNLKGVALWRLGFESDGWWKSMGSFREQPET